MSATVTEDRQATRPLPDDIVRLAVAGAWPDVEAASTQWLEANGRTSDGLLLLAVAAYKRHDLAAAIRFATNALELGDASREAAEFLALMQVLVGDLNGSLFSTKLASALPSSASHMMPADLPNFAGSFLAIERRPLIGRAITALAAQDWVAVEHWFRQQIEVEPDCEEGYLGLAYCLSSQERFREAAEVLRGGRHALPGSAILASQLGAALTALGDFGMAAACHRAAIAKAADDAVIHAQSLQDAMQDPDVAAPQLAEGFRRWGETYGEKEDPWMPRPRAIAKSRLTVGYLLSGVGRREHASFLADILAHHDARSVRVVGFGYGTLSEPANTAFQRSVSVWQNVRGSDPYTLSAMVAAEDIDILVDASGFTTPEMLKAFGLRMAPVQLSWLGAPYGTGLKGCDAVLSDSFLDPAGGPGIIHLDHGAALAALPHPTETAAEHHGLVLAADATFAELCPRTVAAWASILHAVPNATLVLRSHDFRSEGNARHLVGLFGNFGVSHRIDVAEGSRFFEGADVALLPYQTLRSEVVAQALAEGVPVVGWLREGRHRREALALLHYLGLDGESMAATDDAYVALAIDWSRDASRRAGFRDRLLQGLQDRPVLSAAARATDLERVYRELWQKALSSAG